MFSPMMAEAAEADKHQLDLKTIRAKIICPICKKRYMTPKILPCLHSFCTACLKAIGVVECEDMRLECPQCKKEVHIPEGDFAKLPDAFFVNQLIVLYDFMQKVDGRVEVKCEKCSNKSVRASSFCQDCGKFICDLCVTIHQSWAEFHSHKVLSMRELKEGNQNQYLDRTEQVKCSIHGKECVIYCETCHKELCHECIIKTHRDHQYNLSTDSAAKHKAITKERLETIRGIPHQLELAISKIDGISKGFAEKGQTIVDEIDTCFDELERAMKARRETLVDDINTMVEVKVKALKSQKTELDEVKDKVVTCMDFVNHAIAGNHVSEFFTLERQMAERIAEVSKEFMRLDLSPVEQPDAQFTFDEETAKSLQTIGQISDGSLLHAGMNTSHYFSTSEVITFFIALSSAYYKTNSNPMEEISAEIHSFRDGSVCPATIALSTSGFAKLQCSFSERGRYSIHVKVGDHHISGSPYSLFVKAPATQFQMPLKSVSKLSSPKGVAVNRKNQIVISEENIHQMSVFGRKAKKVFSFGSPGENEGQLSHPIGVTIDTTGCIYVADSKNNRIQKFDQDGNFLAMFSGVESKCGTLNNPTGVKVDQNGDLFVVDRGNSRIVILTPNLSYKFGFRSPDKQLEAPWDIAFDKNGFVYITDTKQHCIQIFNKSGDYRGKIGSYGTQKSRLNRPAGITIDRFGRIFVCESGNHRVSIFHICSDFIECFSTGLSMVNPCGIAIDDDGFIYVSCAETMHVF